MIGHKPPWLKARIPAGGKYFRLKRELAERGLHTVCQSASCPNVHECWNNGQATFLIMGDTCTRHCRFCSVASGIPQPLDQREGEKIAEMVRRWRLPHVVLTSVTRDDLEDRGSSHYAAVIRAIKGAKPDATVEVLIPDLDGSTPWLDTVLAAAPDVVAHNVETVKEIYPHVNRRPSSYQVSLRTLAYCRERGVITKSGLMVGLGEKAEQLDNLFMDLYRVGVRILTIGQYLRPTKAQVPVKKYFAPEEFDHWRESALAHGIPVVMAGPFVRSSYHSAEAHGMAVHEIPHFQ